MAVKTIFPITRIHEPLRVDVDIQGGQVVDAWVGSYLFRGFEAMLKNRDPRDTLLFVQRICGICSCAHSVANALAQQQAFGVKPTPTGQHLTNLIYAADIIQNHLRHFYSLVIFDYVKGPALPPYTPRPEKVFRLPPKVNDELFSHIKEGGKMAARAHEMLAVFGAKAPHQQTIMATGVTEQASAERLLTYSSILQDITQWVEKVLLADVQTIAEYYRDYFSIGAGYGNFLSYGMFPAPVTGVRTFKPGLIINRGKVEEPDINEITEDIRHSWYQDDQVSRHPADGKTEPNPGKPEAYTWVKAPRYKGLPFEGGPLARGYINGDYRQGISVMDRIMARAHETLKICRLAAGWLKEVVPGSPANQPYTVPPAGVGVGLTDAMRGGLGHWMSYKNGGIDHFQVVTPTTWNFSPRDEKGVRGPVEQALIGTPAEDDHLTEVGRVVRSFDPCFTCAVHVMDYSR
ncbi:MAG TPA: nickel-dependent hydrogenase large subunit [Methylomusa anaerophila]|uniref:Periplasmic [NiFeSe] hydrogenase large subunit n=1 Tax=Methylomusa anaerophila TaxID=1930071 RepID=A0A348AGN6_9FIRM|nr:nickel-dependent hydrogenase large subunit [Methylomusa anaerophila]BBB90234.1 periplasmic [NiFeSe] hydrogenase large subunit [Methylomusa anaerophila]HML89418.1 nickel-dependent hydrogenase large subunit [Methylomusa anaerophila]